MGTKQNVEIGLIFTADTGNAKTQLRELKKNITDLYNSTAKDSMLKGYDPKMQSALNSAAKLKVALEEATNVDTGRLDLSKFSRQVEKGQIDLKKLATDFIELGPEGEKAFMQLAQSIVVAEAPIKRVNTHLANMWKSLKNAAGWKISSAIVEGFTNSVQEAYRYAQDLDETLNDIRVVSGQNADEMAKFAKEANKAAKQLSTTTNEYAKASLIYYQQGLSDAEIKERTDVTVKMANVVKESAETVSDQMTAVWNNFYEEGGKSLEYYGDVMVKLGADTASSTDEIAAGLEKFAAVTDTIGLSFEYAASALTTITAKTRESADTVGTALKTIFSRIEGLSLGETLDDGTDLNKYSEALAVAGVNIKDANGELRDMDEILDDLGSRWQTLGRDEQVALAQAVAGVRQYNQLIALMDNWDFFQQNLATSYNATGALNEQQEIYAEGWEAARDKVTAALETIYDDLIDEDFFIMIDKMLAGSLELIDKLINTLGGLPGVLSAISMLVTKIAKDSIKADFSRIVENVRQDLGLTENSMEKTRRLAVEAIDSFNKGMDEGSAAWLEGAAMKQQVRWSHELQQNLDKISETEAGEYKEQMRIAEAFAKRAVEAKRASEEVEKAYSVWLSKHVTTPNMAAEERMGKISEFTSMARQVTAVPDSVKGDTSKFKASEHRGDNGELTEEVLKYGEYFPTVQKKIEAYNKALEESKKTGVNATAANKAMGQALAAITREVKKCTKGIETDDDAIRAWAKSYVEAGEAGELTVEQLIAGVKAFQETEKAAAAAAEGVEAYKDASKNFPDINGKGAGGKKEPEKGVADGLVAGVESLTSFATALNTFKAAYDTVTNSDLSFWERFSGAFSSLIIAVPSLVSGIKDFKVAHDLLKDSFSKGIPLLVAHALGVKVDSEELEKGAGKTIAAALATKMETKAKEGNTLATLGVWVAQKLLNKELKTTGAILLATILPYVVVVLSLAAAVWAVVAALKAAEENSLEARMERAAEAAARATENVNNLSTEIDELKTNLDSLSDVESTFNGLKEGTAEWNIALMQANQKVADLLQKYPELSEYVQNDSNINGLKIISQQGQEDILNQQAETLSKAQGVATQKQLDEAKLELEEAKEKEQKVFMLTESYRSSEKSQSADAINVTFNGNTLTKDEYDRIKENKLSDPSFEFSSKNSLNINPDSTTNSDLFYTTINRGMDQLLEVLTEEEKLQAQIQLLTKATIENTNAMKDGYQDSEYRDTFTWLQAGQKEQKENAYKSEHKGDSFDTTKKSYIDYLKETTGDEYKFDGKKLLKKTAEGGWEDTGQEFSQEEMIDTLAAYDSSKITDEDIEKWSKDIENIKNSFFESGKEIKVNGRALTEEEAAWLAQEIYKREQDSSYKIDLTKMFGDNSTLTGRAASYIEDVANGVQDFNKTTTGYKSDQQDLINEAGKYDVLSEKVSEYKQQLSKLAELESNQGTDEDTKSQIKEKILDTEDYLKGMTALGAAAEENEWEFESLAAQTKEVQEEYGISAEAAANLVIRNRKLNEGVKKLNSSWADWKKALKASDKTTEDYADAVVGVTDALKDMLGVSGDLTLPDDFYDSAENLELIEEAANGSSEALTKLGFVAAKAALDAAAFNKEIASTDDGKSILGSRFDEAAFEGAKQRVLDGIITLQNALANGSAGVNDSLNKILEGSGRTAKQWANDLNNMALAAGWSKQDMEDYLSSMNLSAEVEERTIKMPETTVPKYLTETKIQERDERSGWPTKTVTTTRQDGVAKVPGQTITVPAIAMGDNGEPDIKVVSRGSINPSSVGGSGSGSSSKPSKVTKSKKSDVVDRYKEVTDKIDDVTDSLDKASEAADRLYGKARIKAMEEQIALMEKENKLLAQKRKEAESYLKIDKSALNKAAKEAGVSLTYDSLGNITNYTTQMTKLYNQLAAAQDKMNSFSSKDAQDEFQEATLDPLQEKIDNLKEALSQYEETRELIEDLNAEIRSNKNEIEDLQFETFQYKIELKIEIDERSLNYIEYQLDKIEDKAFAAAERVRLIGGSGSKIESLYNQVQTNQKAINDIMADNLSKNDKKLFDAGDIDKINWQSYINNGTFLESEVDALKEYADNLLDLNQELQEALDLVHEQLTNAFDEWNDEIAEGVELFDHYGSIVDYMSEMVELTAGLAGYSAELNKTIAEVRTTAAQERADAAAQVLADQQAARDLLQSKINDTDWFSSLSEEERQRWLDNLDEAEAAVRQAEEDLFSATSEAMSAAMEKFQATFTAILRDVEKTMTEAGSFDEELSQLERQEEIAERTLAAYQEIYELSKLNRDVLNSIDETDNIKAKEALREIQEEILEKQADGQKMSQYELDYLRKKYELRLAEIALEEAQNAKSKVRMSRDNEGNWGYVYTADQDKIDEARQNYEDKLYEITELTTNYADEVSRSLLETQQQYQEAMQNLADQAAEGYFESEEEYQQAVRELTEYHQGLIDFQLDELEKATENSNYLYTQEWQNYKFSTGNKIASDEDFRNSFQETYAAQISGYKSAAQFAEDWRKATTKAAEKAAESYSVLANDMNTSLKNLGTTLGELNGDFNKYLKDDKNSIINKTNEAKDTIVKTSQTARDALIGKNGLLGAMATLATEWDKKVSAIVKKTEGLVKAVDAANAKLTGEEEKKKSSSSSSSNNSKNSSTSSGGKTQGNGKIEVGDSVGVVNGATWYYDSYGTSPTGVAHAGRIKYINLKGTHPYNIDGLGWVKKEDITGYASGGYTGKWGQEGKLALLHEKELVLNKEDTENFLAGMKLLENITKFISLRSILPDTSKLEFGGKNVVEQDVTIHADFPNVSDHNEIELALSNLVNAASQYAFSKK